jgi:tetratricopeptide (TPR) repeat protein
MTTAITTSKEIDLLWDYDYPLSSEGRFRAALAPLPPASPMAVELMTQIARAIGLQGQFDVAHTLLDQAKPMLTEAMPCAAMRYLLERGRLHYLAKTQLDHAYCLFEQARDQALAQGADFYAIDAVHMLGLVAPLDAQLAWNLKGLELVERTADPRARLWRGTLYMNIGLTFSTQGRYDSALEYLYAAEQELAKHTERSPVRRRIIQWHIRRTLKAMR